MIQVVVSGMGSSWRLDTPDRTLIGPWLLALFKDFKPDARMGAYFTINVSGE